MYPMSANYIGYLNDKALQLRRMARIYKIYFTDALLRLADELEEKAAEIAARSETTPD
jgi:hypothetical protein